MFCVRGAKDLHVRILQLYFKIGALYVIQQYFIVRGAKSSVYLAEEGNCLPHPPCMIPTPMNKRISPHTYLVSGFWERHSI